MRHIIDHLLPAKVRGSMFDHLSTLVWDDKLVGTRFLLALAEFFWGSTMLVWGVHNHLFARPTYKVMDMLGNELGWGILFLWSSAMQLLVVLTNDFHSRGARTFAGLNALLWVTAVGGALFSVYPPPSAMGAEFAATLMAIWIFWRPYVLIRFMKRAAYATSHY